MSGMYDNEASPETERELQPSSGPAHRTVTHPCPAAGHVHRSRACAWATGGAGGGTERHHGHVLALRARPEPRIGLRRAPVLACLHVSNPPHPHPHTHRRALGRALCADQLPAQTTARPRRIGRFAMAAWAGYAFVVVLVPAHALLLLLAGRYSQRLYVAFGSFYVFGQLFALQVRVDMRPREEHEAQSCA